jgi:thiol:disulfide interchange protein DsbC
MSIALNIHARALAACLLLLAAAAAGPARAADKVVSTDASKNSAGAAKLTSTSQSESDMPDPAADKVKALFTQRFPDLDVTAVRRTPYGLFEVQIGMDLIYTDEKVGWVMEGPLIDAATRHDITRERQEILGAISFDQLPLDLAVKQVRGNGARKVAIFEDPNCGYCKQLRHTLEDQTDLTIYTFLYPILAPDSKVKVRDVWCSSNPAAAWDAWMLHGKVPPTKDCAAPTDKVLALGQKLMVRGTPTLFFADGSRVSGALPLDELQARLNKKKGS